MTRYRKTYLEDGPGTVVINVISNHCTLQSYRVQLCNTVVLGNLDPFTPLLWTEIYAPVFKISRNRQGAGFGATHSTEHMKFDAILIIRAPGWLRNERNDFEVVA